MYSTSVRAQTTLSLMPITRENLIRLNGRLTALVKLTVECFQWLAEVDQISTILWKSSPLAIQIGIGWKRKTNAWFRKK
jgi:hypothetical protein